MTYTTEQEAFWAGEFGTHYIERNQGAYLLASNLAFFSRALQQTTRISSCIEFGANIGMNLAAIKLLYPDIHAEAIEINPTAALQLRLQWPEHCVHEQSILDYVPDRNFDLVLIKGVLIHIHPDYLPQTYDKLVDSTGRYLLLCEYYNPSPIEIPYRGHQNRMFKRDFCGEILDRHPQLKLIDYGFVYRRDPSFPQDDITWFLIDKQR